VNGQYIDYQLRAEYDKLPVGQKLRDYIEDLDGSLPPGIDLDEDGRLYGQVTDKLKLLYKSASKGGYDIETYDNYPYDHVTVAASQLGTTARFIAKLYQFYVSVTDGVSISKRLFKIRVEDTGSLRVDNTYIDVDTTEYLADAGYLLSPQWLTPANLGVVRANNKQVIKLDVYDFNPFYGPKRYDWDTPTVNQDGTPSIHPPNFELDTSSGMLYATLPYQPAYSKSYKFTVLVIKKDNQTLEETATARTFTLTIKGDVESTIEFVTDLEVGELQIGYQSELSITAKHLQSNYGVQYRLVDGTLPSGLTLLKDGSISGKINYDTQTTIDYYKTLTTFDGGLTTIDKKWYFTVEASDVYQQSAIEKEFYIKIVERSSRKFTRIYAEPLVSKTLRQKYVDFVTDSYTFDRSLIYRLDDPEFGLQEKIKLFFEHGIEQIKLQNYSDAIRKYFYRKKFYFGEVKYNRANDQDGNHVYDIVYVEIIDPLEGIKGPVTVGNQTIYPNSVANMRNQLEIVRSNGDPIETDEYMMPRFMRTIQSDTGSPLGFILAAPLCYALPGKGDTIVKRIKLADFDFKLINFEIDRLVVEDNLTNSGAKYLLFPRRDITGVNPGENKGYIYTTEGTELYTEDGVPLFVEF
jgi:hypothetical protein